MASPAARQFQQRVALVGDRAAASVSAKWLAGGHDESDIAAFAKRATPTLAATKVTAVATGSAYYSRLIRKPAVGVRPNQIELVPDFRSPFIAYWRSLKMGNGDDAVQAGAARAEAVARNFATSAARLAGGVVLARAGFKSVRWIRVPDAEACDWCLDAAEGDFPSAADADFGHDRCGCSIEPVI